MTKCLIIIITLCSALFACGQSSEENSASGLTINPTIKPEVERNISNSEFGDGQDNILVYNNLMMIDFFENDDLVISMNEDDNKSTVFK